MKRLLKKNLFLLFLLLITCLICYKNYTPGTFLTGWDTLHPEFNLKLYWNRIIDGVWQEHQGLGAVASQAHAAEIPRFLILLTMSLILKLNQIRYAYAFLMLIMGPVGIYFLIKWLLPKNNVSDFASGFAPFAGGLFYLLNLGTLQHFYVPLEMFLTHYGLLGFVFLYAVKFFDEGKKRDLFLYLVFSLFIAPQAHTSTLFYAYFLVFAVSFGLLTINYVVRKVSTPAAIIKKYVLLLALTLLVNSFWIMPNLYFVVNHGEEIRQSKIHHLFSTEAFLANQEYGSIKNVAIIKNFLFNWGEHVGNAEFGDLLQEWNLHLGRPFVLSFGYFYFAFIVIGLIVAFLTRQKHIWAVAGVFFVSIFFLFNDNPPLGFIFRFFQNNLPLFKEAFRFPFTKFSISLMFSFSILFGYFFYFVTEVAEKWVRSPAVARMLKIIFSGAVILSLAYYMRPVFGGYLISPSMRIEIPDRYFQLFNHLNEKDEFGRVADLPIHTFWGWVYYNWDPFSELGYQGAGFLWFGIKQPLMDREFDRWNLMNEGYYMEMSRAVYSENPKLFKQVLDKYKLKWVLLDESVIIPGGEQSQLFYKEIIALISKVPTVSLEKDFGGGLKLYSYMPEKSFSLYENVDSFYRVQDSVFKESDDPVYTKFGNYVSGGEDSFPFAGISNYNESILPKYLDSDEQKIIFKTNPGNSTVYSVSGGLVNSYNLIGRARQDGLLLELTDTTDPTKVSASTLIPDNTQYLLLSIGDRLYKTGDFKAGSGPVLLGNLLIDLSADTFGSAYKEIWSKAFDQSGYSVLENCSEDAANSYYQVNKLIDGFTLTGKNTRACVTMDLNKLLPNEIKEGDIVKIAFDGEAFTPVKDVCIFNNERGLCENVGLSDRANYVSLKTPVDKYNVRFFADARGSDTPVSRTFRNLKISLLSKSAAFPFTLNAVENNETIGSGNLVFEKVSGYYGKAVEMLSNPRPCDGKVDEEGYSMTKDNDAITYSSTNKKSLCDSFWFPSFPHDTGLVMEVDSKNISGSPLRICLTNEYSKRCDLYIELPENKERTKNFYLIPPMEKGAGYTVNVSNLVFGNETASNQLYYLGLTPVPYEHLKSLHTEVTQSKSQSLLIYNQAYEKGWIATCGWKLCKADHVLVNNWANGWVFENGFDQQKVKVVFWPQLFEYLGFVLAGACIVFVLKRPSDR